MQPFGGSHASLLSSPWAMLSVELLDHTTTRRQDLPFGLRAKVGIPKGDADLSITHCACSKIFLISAESLCAFSPDHRLDSQS